MSGYQMGTDKCIKMVPQLSPPHSYKCRGWVPKEGALHKCRHSQHLHCLVLPRQPHNKSLLCQVMKDILSQPLNLDSMIPAEKSLLHPCGVIIRYYPVSVHFKEFYKLLQHAVFSLEYSHYSIKFC